MFKPILMITLVTSALTKPLLVEYPFYYHFPQAVSHQSRVDIHNSPAVVASRALQSAPAPVLPAITSVIPAHSIMPVSYGIYSYHGIPIARALQMPMNILPNIQPNESLSRELPRDCDHEHTSEDFVKKEDTLRVREDKKE